MATRKAPRKKTAKKSMAKRAATSAKKTVKKVARSGKSLTKKAASTASKVTRKTKQVARGAQKVGKVMGVIGSLMEAGGKAAEDLTTKVESRGRKALVQSRKSAGRAASARKKR